VWKSRQKVYRKSDPSKGLFQRQNEWDKILKRSDVQDRIRGNIEQWRDRSHRGGPIRSVFVPWKKQCSLFQESDVWNSNEM
jgi:hypothetical protein